jgi:hypothetical protein
MRQRLRTLAPNQGTLLFALAGVAWIILLVMGLLIPAAVFALAFTLLVAVVD